MKTKIYLQIMLMAVTLFFAALGCIREDLCDCPPENGQLTLGLSFRAPETRALDEEAGNDDGDFNENAVNSLDLFFYDGNTLKWHVGGSAYSYDSGTQKATIPVTSDKQSLFDGTKSYDIYVVANNTADLSSIAEEVENLDDLQNLIFQTADFATKGGSEAQTAFVMDGKITKSISLNDPDLGTVNLKRAASKIRLRLVEVNIPDYVQEGTPTARLVHFTDKSILLEEGTDYIPASTDWKDTGIQDLSVTFAGTDEITTAAPFYAYSNDWSTDKAKETYIELYIPLRKEDDPDNETSTFKYRIPITSRNLTGDETQYKNKLQRNLLYDISVTVKILGSLEEPPVDVEGNYQIIDWTTQEVLVDIKGSHYLVVSETNVTMPNISSYTLNFNSSIPNVTMVENSLEASYTYVNNDTGVETTVSITSGNQFPTVTVEPNVASGTISINSAIPVNYIPKDITFQVTNGQLTETVTVKQMPATYFMVTKGVSSAHYDDFEEVQDAELNNPYMYSITTLAPDGEIIWGFPPVDANGNTINSAEVAKMVSPKFEMASQFGASLPKSYSEGQSQCNDYWEEAEDGTVKTGWRLPTEAEIEYIDNLQHDSNNPQGMVMTGKWYWDAYSSNGAYQMQSGSGGAQNEAYVRCIRDIKD